MKFLVDAQLPPALARALADLGHDAVHVADVGLRTASDAMIWKEARERGFVIITKDEDFVGGGSGRFGNPAPSVVWMDGFLPLLPQILDLLAGGEKVIEVRK